MFASEAVAADEPQRRELVEMREETAKFFEEPDGSKTAEFHTGPIHYRAANGKWEDVDRRVVASSKAGFAWRNRAGGIAIDFAQKARAKDAVSLSVGGESLTFGPVGASAATAQVSGNSLTYPSVYPGVDLRYEITSTGLRESFVLHRDPGVDRFRFSIDGTLSLSITANGGLQVSSRSGERVLTSPPPTLEESPSDAPEPAFSRDVRYELGSQTLDVVFDRSWLTAPGRVWPVILDPPSDHETDLETFVHQLYPTTNFNNDPDLRTGSYQAGAVARTYMRFENIATLQGKTIQNATLKLYEYWSSSCTPKQVDVRNITSGWGPTTMTWNSGQPSYSATPEASQTVAYGNSGSCPANWVQFNLKNLVTKWANLTANNNGVAIVVPNESDTNSWKRFRSQNYSDASLHPVLNVGWNTPPTVPTNLSPPSGTGWTDQTPTLSARFNDPDANDAGFVKFYLYNFSNQLLASAEGTTVLPGQTSSWTVPAGIMTPGTNYYWRASGHDGMDDSATTPGNVNYTCVPLGSLSLDAPANGATVPTTVPAVSVVKLAAPGGAPVYTYQVDDDSSFATPIVTSPGLPTTTTWTTQPGKLKDGATYYWRAMATDGGQTASWTTPRSFSIRTPKLGSNSLWPMWSHGPVGVNEVNGNMTMSLPGPSYPTAAGALSASIGYNSLDSTNHDFGRGWTFDAGAGVDDPPQKVIDHNLKTGADKWDGVEVLYANGVAEHYSHVGASTIYQAPPGDASQLRLNPDQANPSLRTWTLTTEDGTIYKFGDPAAPTSSADVSLFEVETADAAPDLSVIKYTYSGTPLRVSKIAFVSEAAELSALTIGYGASCTNGLVCMTGPDGVTWTYRGDASGRITSIHDGTRELMAFTYDTNDRIVSIKNANDLDPTNASPGYSMNHQIGIAYETGVAANVARVVSVTESSVSGQMTPGAPTTPMTDATWTFAYFGGPATLTDPLSTHASGARGVDGYTELREPGSTTPSVAFYDSLGRTVETRDVFGKKTLTAYTDKDQVAWTEEHSPVAGDNTDGRPTDYTYDDDTDLLLSVTGPDPDGAGGLDRAVTRSRYDETTIGTSSTEGTKLTGLQGAYYKNQNLAGRPIRRTDPNVDFIWTDTKPFPNDPTYPMYWFSVRWTGSVNVTTAGYYTFYTVSDDGTRLTVDDMLAIDDWTTHGVQTHASPTVNLPVGWHRISLDYLQATGTGSVKLQWSCTTCGIAQQTIPTSSLRPDWNNKTSDVDAEGNVSFHHFQDPTTALADYDLQQLTDGTNVITSYSYDQYGRMTSKVMPKGNAGRTIDASGALQGTPDSSYATTWTYYEPNESNALPQPCGITTQTLQAGLLKSYAIAGVAPVTTVYDAAGRSRVTTNGAGSTCTAYDAEGRVVSTQAPGETQSTTSTYDPAGAVLSVTDGSGTVSTEYDEAGRVVKSADSYGAESKTVYDARGNRVRSIVATGPLASSTNYETTHGYDSNDQLTSTTDPAGLQYGFYYDSFGRLKATQYPNGTFSWSEFNAAGWQTELLNRHGTLGSSLPASAPVDLNPIADYTYTYNVEGKKTSETRTAGGLTTEAQSFTFDVLGRLQTVTLPDGTLRRYDYDLDSDRTQIRETPQGGAESVVATYSYDPSTTPAVDALTSVTQSGATTSYAYTSDGQVATRGSDSFTWDGRGRQSGATVGGVSVTYGFDAVGMRRSRVASGATLRLLTSGFETDAAGVITRTPVDGPAGDLASYAGAPAAGTSVEFRYYNGHGDVAATADTSGNRTEAMSYDVFGAPRQSLSSNTLTQRYTGRWDKKLDTTTSLIEMGVRAYDSSIGRFLSIDSVDGGSLNAYEYAAQDPINNFDLDGKKCWSWARSMCRTSRAMARWYNKRAYDYHGWIAGYLGGGGGRTCGVNVRCKENSRFVPPGSEAWTVGHTVICKRKCHAKLLRHELAHVKQYEKYGWTFGYRYLWSSAACRCYANNIYERRARYEAGY